jgi:hypothetical protein
MKISCNSQSVIFLANNLAYHSKTKHVDVKYHFVRDMVENNKVLLQKVDILENILDSLTNSVSAMKFSWCRGHCYPGSVNESSKVSWFQHRKQQVGECWVVILFAVKVQSRWID